MCQVLVNTEEFITSDKLIKEWTFVTKKVYHFNIEPKETSNHHKSKTLTVCVLSNTANLLRATHTAVNPDALLPSDTNKQREAVQQVKHTMA